MLEILTPLSKLTRVSRQIDPATFVAVPGIWAVVGSDGGLTNVADGVKSKINKLVISSASSNKYESNDVEVGRIATLETPGTRCKVDSAGYDATGGLANGDNLVVSVDESGGTIGKLIKDPSGSYEIVARAEQYDSTAGTLIYEIVSPRLSAI